MSITIIEIKSPADFASDLPPGGFNKIHRSIKSKIGRYSTVFTGDHCGTVKDSGGKCFDWFLNDNGNVVVIPAN